MNPSDVYKCRRVAFGWQQASSDLASEEAPPWDVNATKQEPESLKPRGRPPDLTWTMSQDKNTWVSSWIALFHSRQGHALMEGCDQPPRFHSYFSLVKRFRKLDPEK